MRVLLILIVTAFMIPERPLPSPQIHLKHIEIVSRYPPLARLAQLQGTVKVQLQITSDGTISSIATSGAQRMLQEATKSMLNGWTFTCDGCSPGKAWSKTLVFDYRILPTSKSYDDTRVLIDLPDHFTIAVSGPQVQTSH